VSETVIFPEMLEAGLLTLKECREHDKTEYETVLAVFLAMRAIEEIAAMKRNGAAVH
jgi:hypothetical protein